MATRREFVLQPGESRLVSTGIALQVPKGTYGRIASRNSLACRGIDIGGGVARGEIKVILYNRGEEQVKLAAGDRVAHKSSSRSTKGSR